MWGRSASVTGSSLISGGEVEVMVDPFGQPGPGVLWVRFGLLMLQGWSELIKRIAFLKGLIEDPTAKKVEKTAEEELAESIRRLREAAAGNGTGATKAD